MSLATSTPDGKPSLAERMIRDSKRTIAQLDAEIAVEERRTGKSDPTAFDYSTFATACRRRRDNLAATVALLEAQNVPAVADEPEIEAIPMRALQAA